MRRGVRSGGLALSVGGLFFIVAYASIVFTRGGAFFAPLWLGNALALVFLLRLTRSRLDGLAMLLGVIAAGIAANSLTQPAPPGV